MRRSRRRRHDFAEATRPPTKSRRYANEGRKPRAGGDRRYSVEQRGISITLCERDMRRIIRTMLGGVCLAIFISPTLALIEFGEREEFGPARDQERKLADKRRAVTCLPGRVYLYQKDWSGPLTQFGNNGVAAYQGDAEAANQALGELARLPADTAREIQLLPAPGVSRS